MENKLLSCPFCGKIDTLIVGSDLELSCKEDYDDWSELNSETFAVACDFLKGGCGATSGFRDSKEFAIHTWNTRSRPEAVKRLVKAASDALSLMEAHALIDHPYYEALESALAEIGGEGGE